MPIIFLSPSMAVENRFVDGGNEQEYMNGIADAMEPYLRSSGIRFIRTALGASFGQAIRESNAGYYDLHLSLFTDASPQNMEGRLMGADIYYYSYGTRGRPAAELIAANYKRIYPNPSLVKAVPTNRAAEIVKTNAPAVSVRTAYRDNKEDSKWLKENVNPIAASLVESITQYFGLPFVTGPRIVLHGTVSTDDSGELNLHSRPDGSAQVIAKAQNNTPISILGVMKGWYVVDYRGDIGYADAKFILI